MKRIKIKIICLAILVALLSIAGCIDPIGPFDWNSGNYDKNGNIDDTQPRSYHKFFAMYGDFKAHDISNASEAAEFCKITAWKYFSKIEYYQSGPDSGYAYMVECCSY